jgi:hypothetical protein
MTLPSPLVFLVNVDSTLLEQPTFSFPTNFEVTP